MSNFFFKSLKGLKAEIKRHNNYEADLIAKIDALDPDSEFDQSVKITYENILTHLRNSRDSYTSKIGKKK